MGRLCVIEGAKLNLSEVTILVAGANATEVDVAMQIFAGFGARQLRRAEGLPQVREALEREVVDLLVLDAMLGMEACVDVVRTLRRMPGENRLAPVFVTTAHASPTVVQAARETGVNYVVAKPLTPRVLFERLVWVVKDPRAFVECETYVGPDRRVRALGPPPGMAGRRADDLPEEIGDASSPNMSQADIDAMLAPARKAR